MSEAAAVLAGARDWALVAGDVRGALAALPDACVHCCVTSPPYWNLRAYSTTPQVWGGRATCEHDWVEAARAPQSGGAGVASAKQVKNIGSQLAKTLGLVGTCRRCGAWRGELGSEPTPDLFVQHLVAVFAAVRRVLRPDGLLWVNLGDSYSGSGKGPSNSLQPAASQLGARNTAQFRNGQAPTTWTPVPPGIPPKNLALVPERFALAMQAAGWVVRSRVAWCKTSAMPESVRDRPTSAWEHVFMFAAQGRYYYDADAVRVPVTMTPQRRETPHGYQRGPYVQNGEAVLRDTPAVDGDPAGANLRNYWVLGPSPFPGAHFATYPPELVRRCILASTSAHGCCAACGAPYARVVERTGQRKSDEAAISRLVAQGVSRQTANLYAGGHQQGNAWGEVRTVGWQPTCRCAVPDVLPAIVLDCFSGAGTTGVVALRHGRRYLGLELNAAYNALARDRIVGDAPLWNTPVDTLEGV